MLLAFYLYLKAQNGDRSIGYVISITSGLIAVFTYEAAAVLFLLLGLWELIFKKKITQRIVPFAIITLFYFFVRFALVGIIGRGEYLAGSFYLTMLIMIKAILRYIELLAFPVKLALDQTIYGGIKAHPETMPNLESITSQSVFNFYILLSLAVIVGSLFLAFKILKKHPIFSFGIGWFYICLLPFLFILPQGAIMQERYIYLASFGFVFVLAYIVIAIFNKKIFKVVMIIFLIMIASGYWMRTFARNFDWRSEEKNWLKLAQDFPLDVQANFISAQNFQNLGDFDQAIFYYNQALKSDPKLMDAQLELSKLGASNDWKEYKFEDTFSFYYPSTWKISADNQGVLLSDNNFSVQFRIERLQKGQSFEKYLNQQTETFGQLVNQGLAQIPNVQAAYVKFFNDNKIQKLQFFLFKGDKVLKILVYPSDSTQMKIFEKIISSLQIR